MQLKVTNSPFTEEQAELINRLLPTLTDTQTQWLGGYLTFYRNGAGASESAVAMQAAVLDPIEQAVPVVPAVPREATILFGSQTGNAQRLAGRLAGQLKEQGYEVTLSAMNQYKTKELKSVAHLFIVASTHGEGDPPDNALTFHEFLYGKRAPKLDGMKFSVLSLGDTSYEFFCKTGKDFDERLEALGAERLTDRIDCDLDFEEPATTWFVNVVQALHASTNASTNPSAMTMTTTTTLTSGESQYSRSNPFQAEVLTTINLNGRGSDRETRHLELSLEGSGLTYEPGDCVGIYPENDPSLVDQIIAFMNWNAGETVVQGKDGNEGELRSSLLRHYEITVLTKPLLEKALAFTTDSKLSELLLPEQKEQLKTYIEGRDLLDLLQDFGPWKLTATDLVSILRKLPPRLYSIASSIKANPEEVHVTIRRVQYESANRERHGVCSSQTAERLVEGDTLPIFIQQNPNFKLPANPATPVIMIGPGTGVAPFRAFLEEREEDGANGKTWLFYGDRHFVTDFLYQTDWQRMMKDGVLTNLDVAFSRDTEEKVYVQHRLLEHAAELYAWLQEGAHVYVCGDEKYMAHDVHAALLTIIQEQGGLSPEAAAIYIEELQIGQRYQRDVY